MLDEEREELYRKSKPLIELCVDPEKWIILITQEGIKFNHKEYPKAAPEDFARAFIEILEKQYHVTFEKREKDES